jgi:3-carboxy-cis,cis-muconate cycloisomerase
MRQPSSTSEPGGSLSEVLARGRVRALTGDVAWLTAMVEVEIALARSAAKLGLIPLDHATAIERAGRALVLDPDAIGQASAATGTPVVPLVDRIRAAVGDPAAASVHRGATSQDIVDTATMLIADRAIDTIVDDLRAASDAAAGLAREHRTTPIAGRTLLQHAVPTTFGLKAAGWMVGLDRAIRGLADARVRQLAVQLGGAAGTLAPFEGQGRRMVIELAGELGLPAPVVPWHTERSRIGELAGVLGVAGGTVMKPARDIVLLAQTEVAEVAEGAPGRGGSSTLPQKHNPIAAVSAIASAQRVPGLVATLLASMAHEHERAAGYWHAEWLPMRDLLVAVGSAAAWLRDCLEHLEIRPAAMERNLAADGGLALSERVVDALTPRLGRSTAVDLVTAAASDAAAGKPFAAALVERDGGRSGLDRPGFEALLDPAGYLGEAPQLVDEALRAHADERRP